MRVLKANHPILYRRIMDLIYLKFLIGIALIFSPPIPTPTVNATNLASILSLRFWGAIFVILGIALYFSLVVPNKTYRFTRLILLASFGYDLLWLASLVVSVFVAGLRSGPITVLWAYFTLNVYRMAVDPGWQTIALIKEVQERNGGDIDGVA